MTTPLRPHAGQLDADLARTVRRTAYMRQGFYVVVLLVALAGQVSGAVERLHIPLVAALPAVAALELGGIVVLANADVRRRLGERANASRILSAAIAAGAVAFNWLAHADHLLGGFFAGMSALGYLVWLMHTENMRRDRLRSTGDLAWTTPAYELVGHWLAHPWLTRRARALAKANPALGLYDSLADARAAIRRERREAAIARVLHAKIRKAVKGPAADIAVHTYDLDEVARRLAASADYDGFTALIAADLHPSRLAPPAAAEVAPEVASTPPADPPADALTLAELTSAREVAGQVALPAALPAAAPPAVVVVTVEPTHVPAPRTARSTAPRRWSPALRRAVAHRRPVAAAAPGPSPAVVAREVATAPPAEAGPVAPKTPALPVTDRLQELADLVATRKPLTPAKAARILGTDNLAHVGRTLRKTAKEDDGSVTPTGPRPGDQRPTAPPPRPARHREERSAQPASRPTSTPPPDASAVETATPDDSARGAGGAVGEPPRARRPRQPQPDRSGPDGA
jgi:hypothetical protein